MRISGYKANWDVNDVAAIGVALSTARDARGGGEFWLSDHDHSYPVLAIRASGNLADVHYFPKEGHPGFRALGSGEGLELGGISLFVWDGCDPSSGEEVANEYVVSFDLALAAAKEFFARRELPASVKWIEL